MADKKTVYNPAANTFSHEDKKYMVLVPSCIIPGFNKNKPMTALEISTDAGAQKYLVEEAKAFDTVIAEVLNDAPAAKVAE